MPEDEPGTGQPPAKTFTQDDLNRIVTREKAQAEAAKERAIAEALGCTVDEAKAKIKAASDAEAAALSAAEKTQREAETAKAAADKALADAQLLRRDTVAERELLRAGF